MVVVIEVGLVVLLVAGSVVAAAAAAGVVVVVQYTVPMLPGGKRRCERRSKSNPSPSTRASAEDDVMATGSIRLLVNEEAWAHSHANPKSDIEFLFAALRSAINSPDMIRQPTRTHSELEL